MCVANIRAWLQNTQPVGKSKTKIDVRSYYWNSNFDGTNTRGEGTLNWKGTSNWRGSTTAGISLYGGTKGASGFSNNPNGGRGCKKDVGRSPNGRNHWSGVFNLQMSHSNYDSYIFMCNGAQHTSSTCDACAWIPCVPLPYAGGCGGRDGLCPGGTRHMWCAWCAHGVGLCAVACAVAFSVVAGAMGACVAKLAPSKKQRNVDPNCVILLLTTFRHQHEPPLVVPLRRRQIRLSKAARSLLLSAIYRSSYALHTADTKPRTPRWRQSRGQDSAEYI